MLLPAPARPQPPAQAEAGWQALQEGDGERAAAVFRETLTRNPRDPTLHFGAGVAAHLLGRESDAMTSLKRALELEPRLVDAAVLLGEIQHREGDIDAAIRTYERALKGAPANTHLRARLDAWRKESAVDDTLEHWKGPRFSVSFEGQTNKALGQRAFSVLDAAYLRIGKAIGAYPADHITVVLYSEEQFYGITRVPPWVDGVFDGRIRIPVKGAAQKLAQFDAVLAHELTHAMVSGLANRGVPGWLHEGLASYFERRDPMLAARRVKASGIILPMSKLQGSFIGLEGKEIVVAYEQSLVAADVLMKRLGTQTSILLGYLGRGYTFEDALPLLGLSAAQFEHAVMSRLR
jgi:tetratricopeptide (TPR) repeat protein